MSNFDFTPGQASTQGGPDWDLVIRKLSTYQQTAIDRATTAFQPSDLKSNSASPSPLKAATAIIGFRDARAKKDYQRRLASLEEPRRTAFRLNTSRLSTASAYPHLFPVSGAVGLIVSATGRAGSKEQLDGKIHCIAIYRRSSYLYVFDPNWDVTKAEKSTFKNLSGFLTLYNILKGTKWVEMVAGGRMDFEAATWTPLPLQ